jgi:dimethylargininase
MARSPGMAHAIVRGVPDSFEQATARYFGSGPTDVVKARRQHAAYVAALRDFGVAVTELAADEAFPDCIFVEDQAVVHDGRALLTHSGLASRRGEQPPVAAALDAALELDEMEPPAVLDGGDVLRVGNCYLVGISTRTTRAGAQALRDFVAPLPVHEVAIPDDQLHLKSICTSPGEGLLLAPEHALRDGTLERVAEVIRVPAAETYACNVLVFGRELLLPDGYPATHALLAERGFQLHPLEMSQIRAADGSPTCLSVFY